MKPKKKSPVVAASHEEASEDVLPLDDDEGFVEEESESAEDESIDEGGEAGVSLSSEPPALPAVLTEAISKPAPKASLTAGLVPKAVPVAHPVVHTAAPVERKIRVMPRQSISSFRVGPHYYSITKGTPVDLPQAVVEHLRERDIV